jgi:hypothetical protein
MKYTDYTDKGETQLMNLLEENLAAKQWKNAHELTKFILVKNSNQREGSYLSLNIGKLSSTIVNEIDDLWQNYSDYHFI